jgi:HEAT repeat protein
MKLVQAATLLGALAASNFVAAAAPQNGSKVDPALRTDAQLRSYGIEITPESLLTALGNSNPRVRYLSAFELIDTLGKDALPAIKGALAAETDPFARVELAVALVAAKDGAGVEHLKMTCADPNLPLSAIDMATQTLQQFHLQSGHCAGAILASLPQPGNGEWRAIALTLLPTIYVQVSQDQKDRIVIAIEEMLRDNQQEQPVHLRASQALAQIGLSSSIEPIRDAISREKDPNIRSSLERDLETLEAKKPPIHP